MSTQLQPPYLDHLAFGVRSWGDTFPTLVHVLGGTWVHGGDAGEFAACQLVYRDDMRLELIAPGAGAESGFMHRFLEAGGPRPHHLTFKVPSLEAAVGAVQDLGIETFGRGTRGGFWNEAFVHPKHGGLGTLIQLVQLDKTTTDPFRADPPPDYPRETVRPRDFAWIGLTTDALGTVDQLLGGLLGGTIADEGTGWHLYSWGDQRRLLLRTPEALPVAGELWPAGPGVAHIVLGDPAVLPSAVDAGSLRPVQLPGLGLPAWELAGDRRASAQPAHESHP